MTSIRDLSHEFLHAWAASDTQRFSRLLDQDVVFESPVASHIGREAVVAAMAEFSQLVTGIEIIASAAHDDSALVMYDMQTGPFGTIRASEHYQFRDGKIVSDQLVFDTSALQR